jgi:uncharacterized membrane protein
MSYQEKRTIVMIAQEIAILAAYCIYVTGKIRQGAAGLEDLRFFAVSMLIFLGIGIAVTIAVQVIFHVLLSVSIAVREREKEEKAIESAINAEMVEDERDKIIELKSTRIQMIVAMAGFVAGLVMLALDCQPAVMLNTLFIAAVLGAIGEGVAKLIYYRAGVRHG